MWTPSGAFAQQLKGKYRYYYFKDCAWDCNYSKHYRSHGYCYNESILKFSKVTLTFFSVQIDQRIQNP